MHSPRDFLRLLQNCTFKEESNLFVTRKEEKKFGRTFLQKQILQILNVT